MLSIKVTWETIGRLSPRSAIVKMIYTIHLTMFYASNDLRGWNTINFLNHKVLCWYVKFTRMKPFHTITIWVSLETVGMVSLRRRIGKIAYTIPSDMVYLKHDHIIWYVNNFVNFEVASWYIKFSRLQLLHIIFVWVTKKTIRNVPLRSTIL